MTGWTVIRCGRLDYRQAFALQRAYRALRAADEVGNLLLWVEHPPTITLGRGGGTEDVRVAEESLKVKGTDLVSTDRGGRATYHGPGQMVVYPIMRVGPGQLHEVADRLEEATIRLLRRLGVVAERHPQYPGVWVGTDKIAAIGLASQDDVTYHGLALNVTTDLTAFGQIVPCGLADRGVISIAAVTGQSHSLDVIARWWFDEWVALEGKPDAATWAWGFQTAPGLSAPAPQGAAVERLQALLRQRDLHTVCEAALCPNLGECWGAGTATFMIGGAVCTRHCRFCGVASGRPQPLQAKEPQRVAAAAAQLGLRHVVVTAVARDDLADGGAGHFVSTIQALRQRLPVATIEVLIPDFAGNLAALHAVCQARPDVLNHNLETVPRLYPAIQPRKNYRRTLGVLEYAKRLGLSTKSGIILGLGETRGEVIREFAELRRAGCDFLTLGQYLPPSDRHAPLMEYVHPVEFGWYREIALTMGFVDVTAGPLVRSSYRAERFAGSPTAARPRLS
ncbi:MAG: lipoyl synthase [Thermaerobacter sp.]|nr:lipoyl synthase [Thermaerobacter sp.]